jgi:hypothetical protein
MPKFDLIQQGVEAPAIPSLGKGSRPGLRRRQESSKRNSRKLSGFYLSAKTVARLKRYVIRRQEAGEKIDNSDVVEQALVAFLSRSAD